MCFFMNTLFCVDFSLCVSTVWYSRAGQNKLYCTACIRTMYGLYTFISKMAPLDENSKSTQRRNSNDFFCCWQTTLRVQPPCSFSERKKNQMFSQYNVELR